MTKSKLVLCNYARLISKLVAVRLNKLLGAVVISQGGVVPFIQPQLLPSRTKKGEEEK